MHNKKKEDIVHILNSQLYIIKYKKKINGVNTINDLNRKKYQLYSTTSEPKLLGKILKLSR